MRKLNGLTIYIAASFKHLHGVRLLASELRRMGCLIFDWTQKAAPPSGLTPAERRQWMDTDQAGGQVYEFCRRACQEADLTLYYGESGQDAGVEIGMAAAYGAPVLGIRGPLEGPGLMLHGAVSVWVEDTAQALEIVDALARFKHGESCNLSDAADKLARIMRKRCEANSAKVCS